tara:strand:+ start:664 stop:999 length:336 start_codon:yes stop_codon:yes gene_type:complete
MNDTLYGLTKKNIVFKETDKRHAELKIRLNYDNMKITEFFQMIISAYLKNDERITHIIDEHKEERGQSEKGQRKSNRNLIKKAKLTKTKFGLNEGEVESIFDILEKEHPDL